MQDSPIHAILNLRYVIRDVAAPIHGLARNTTWLAAGRIASHVFNIALTVVVARGLGSAGFGQYAFVLAVVAIGNIITIFGTESLLVRDIAAKRGDAARLVAAALALQLVLSATVIILVIGGAGWLPGRTGDTVLALRIYVASLLPLAFNSVCSAMLRAWERMDLSALLTCGTAALMASVAFVVLRVGGSLPQLMAALLLAQVVVSVVAWYLCRVVQPGFALTHAAGIGSTVLLGIIRRTWPLALLGGLAILSQRVGVLLLTFLAGDASSGWFAAAFRVVEGLKLAHYSLLAAMSPVAARMVADAMSDEPIKDPEPLAGLLHKSMVILVILGVAAALVATLAAKPIIVVLYGSSYGPAIQALRVLAWTLVPIGAAAPTALGLVSAGHERIVVRTAAIGVVVTLAAGVLLIPRMGVSGASSAVLVGESIRCALLLVERNRIAAPRFAPDPSA